MKELLCITCPNGCRLKVEQTQNGFIVSGNRCKRGEDFAITEMTNPRRSVTSTVRTIFPAVPVLSVRTAGDIPKGSITDLIRLLGSITIRKPVGIGETVIQNALGTGIDVIATSDILKDEVVKTETK
jgi:CxxC motif-containing protein